MAWSGREKQHPSMATQSQTPFAILFYLSCIAISLVSVAYAGNLRLAFPPQKNIKLHQDAYFQADLIMLTPNESTRDMRLSYGYVTFDTLITLWDKSSRTLANFTTHFQFIISEVSSVLSGEGLTFFLAPLQFQAPAEKGFDPSGFGIFDSTTNRNSSNQVVAVEFDTDKNYFDPDDNHVGIDINSMVSNKTASLNASDLLKNKMLKNGEYWDAWVDYDGGKQRLQVFLATNPSGREQTDISKPQSPILSYNIDLRKFLPDNIQVGLSASTGLSLETHTIYAWNFSAEYSWKTESPASNGSRGKKSNANGTSVRVILISVCVVVVSVFVMFVVWWCCLKSNREAPGEESEMELDEWFAQGPRRFSYAELSAATRNFSEEEKLGEGGFGGVYRGTLAGTEERVAVKRISQGSKQGRKEYISEVTIISKLRHRNLVQLLGWCHERGELLLVYELLPNGSLDKYLFGEQKGRLDWERRYSIARDVASALVYLHEDWDQRVVHRDVKASNVMLDSEFNAKVGDFGLARVVERNKEALKTTVVAGTLGYMAPECAVTGKASPESDVFSFGAVCLEIACGKRPLERSLSEHNTRLVEWVWDLYGKGRILDAADEWLGGNFAGEEMERLMALGLLCSHPDPKARPAMREVLKILKFEARLPYIPPDFPVAVYIEARRADATSMSTSTSTSSYGPPMTMSSSSMAR